jgi:hypothetical protein
MISNLTKPKFWFGDRVNFKWFSDDDQIEHTESGVVVGVVFFPKKQCWFYSIIWTDSTVENSQNNYPIYDEEMTMEDRLC